MTQCNLIQSDSTLATQRIASELQIFLSRKTLLNPDFQQEDSHHLLSFLINTVCTKTCQRPKSHTYSEESPPGKEAQSKQSRGGELQVTY